jgi:hypothetical protein
MVMKDLALTVALEIPNAKQSNINAFRWIPTRTDA